MDIKTVAAALEGTLTLDRERAQQLLSLLAREMNFITESTEGLQLCEKYIPVPSLESLCTRAQELRELTMRMQLTNQMLDIIRRIQ